MHIQRVYYISVVLQAPRLMMSNADSNSSNSGNSVLLVGSDSNDEFVPGRGSGVVPERGPDVVPEKDSSAVPEKAVEDSKIPGLLECDDEGNGSKRPPARPEVSYVDSQKLWKRPEARRKRKPVIYIFSPTDIDVSVVLSLIPDLRFAVIYPTVPTVCSPSSGEQVRWVVRTRQDGTLIERNTGLEVGYLFWESETRVDAPLSPPSSLATGQSPLNEQFSPTSCDLCDADSVVLPVSAVSPYLDKTLKILGLHTEARTSFITFWLPYFLKHEYISLRFVPQAAFERVAPLDISPQPDVVTRVFMLFKAVPEEFLESKWPCAMARARDDVEWWADVVGIDLDRALNAQLFRVLEWGGMEVIDS